MDEEELRTWPQDAVAPDDMTLEELALHLLLWGDLFVREPFVDAVVTSWRDAAPYAQRAAPSRDDAEPARAPRHDR